MPTLAAGFEGRFDQLGWFLMGHIFRLKSTLPQLPPRLLDLGMGRGRDLIYFARRGFRVLGVDLDPDALEKARRRAERLGIQLPIVRADIRSYRLRDRFSVVYSSTALNYLPRKVRTSRFSDFKAATIPGGLHAVNAFISKGKHDPAPDLAPNVAHYRPGELLGYYRDWAVLHSGVLDMECPFGGNVHRHVVDFVVARKPR